jgi:hypothetical protein
MANCQFEERGIRYGQPVDLAGISFVCECGYISQDITIKGIYNGHGDYNGTKVDIISLTLRPVVCPDCQTKHTIIGFPCGPSGDYLIQLPVEEPVLIELPVSIEVNKSKR